MRRRRVLFHPRIAPGPARQNKPDNHAQGGIILQERLLHVLTACIASLSDAERALRALRHAAGRGTDSRTLLLFCDLPASSCARELGDDDIVRRLQSGVMAMQSRVPDRFMLLVRCRAWDDAARAYLGDEQHDTPAKTVASLIVTGKCRASFAAASVTPASLKDRFDAALFVPVSLACTPDMPARMLDGMKRRNAFCACARTLPPMDSEESALERLERIGFSLSSVDAALGAHLGTRGLCAPPIGGKAPFEAALFSRPALEALCDGRALPRAALVEDCFFVRQEHASVYSLLANAQDSAARSFARQRENDSPKARLACGAAMLPAVQLALLLLGGTLGLAPLCALAIVLPEYPALVNPRLLPGALVRIALIPAHAACVMQALLNHLTARSRLIRLRVTDGARGASGCTLFGAALLFAAFYGVGALVPLLPVSLLWLSAPLLFPALATPSRERVPLTPPEQERLRQMAVEAFDYAHESPSAPRRMLASCAACMLGLLEPDEAARRAQDPLPDAGTSITPEEQAAMLASAQFFRERMADCDAALRELPATIEKRALSCNIPQNGVLGVLLRAAAETEPSAEATQALRVCQAVGEDVPRESGDALFLPLPLLRGVSPEGVSMPLTHPHTFLKAPTLPLAAPGAKPADSAQRFLFLAAAALSHPFAPLLMRSPVVAPYAPLLAGLAHA